MFFDRSCINDSFDKLWTLLDECSRETIIRSAVSNELLKTFCSSLADLSDSNFKKLKAQTTISPAWMIKTNIFTHNNGGIRLHIFQNNLSDILNDIPKNIHFHDFQWYSHVLMWYIQEDQYEPFLASSDEKSVYNNFLQDPQLSEYGTSAINRVLNKYLTSQYDTLDAIEDDTLIDFLSTKYWDISSLAQYHTIFNSEKFMDWNILRERVWPRNVYRLRYMGSRLISRGNSYFLPAHLWHHIDTDSIGITSTLFVFDRTYKSQNFPKMNDSVDLSRWNAKRFPHE